MAEHSGFEKLVAEAKKHITEISPQDAAAKLNNGDAIVVDVRDRDEWDGGHIPGATHMSRGTIELDIEEKVPDPNAMIICHCGGGGRCALAAETPAKNGLQKRPFHGRGLKSLENSRSADDDIVSTLVLRGTGAFPVALAAFRNTHLHPGVTWRQVYVLCHCVFASLLARCSTLRKSPPCSPPISRTIR